MLAVVMGGFAAIRSTQLSAAAAPRVSAAQIARQNAALSRAEAKLRAELAKKSPAGSATVVYRRPPAIVHVIHRHGGDGHEGGFDD